MFYFLKVPFSKLQASINGCDACVSYMNRSGEEIKNTFEEHCQEDGWEPVVRWFTYANMYIYFLITLSISFLDFTAIPTTTKTIAATAINPGTKPTPTAPVLTNVPIWYIPNATL